MDNQPADINDLDGIIDQRITSLVRELEDANWPTEEIILAMNDLIKVRWLDQINALHEASNSIPKNFVSDGNEG
ncbi:MAG: hypothetical protein JWM58_2538 [Rhizobium sp.]|nr:hypothetical protein [Rhizobium sp.]